MTFEEGALSPGDRLNQVSLGRDSVQESNSQGCKPCHSGKRRGSGGGGQGIEWDQKDLCLDRKSLVLLPVTLVSLLSHS